MAVNRQTLLSWPAELPSISTILLLVAVLGVAFAVYQAALPRPLPGIPYDEKAAKSIFGNLRDILRFTKENGQIMPWFPAQCMKHNSPLVQFWVEPFAKPSIILADYQEIQDILLRRTKEFDRSQLLINVFRGGAPDHHITMRTADPRFKGNKELIRDLMSPSFLQAVSRAMGD
jgi:hypothetical protein